MQDPEDPCSPECNAQVFPQIVPSPFSDSICRMNCRFSSLELPEQDGDRAHGPPLHVLLLNMQTLGHAWPSGALPVGLCDWFTEAGGLLEAGSAGSSLQESAAKGPV